MTTTEGRLAALRGVDRLGFGEKIMTMVRGGRSVENSNHRPSFGGATGGNVYLSGGATYYDNGIGKAQKLTLLED